MIFNANESYTSSIKESPYEIGIDGALMHVYENECNYNALMKAVGISELRYYNATGGDLFVQEAGVFNKLIDTVKTFFTNIINKIKEMLVKFTNWISNLPDREFVKKYKDRIKGINLTNFEFKGFPFPKLEEWEPDTSGVEAECSWLNLEKPVDELEDVKAACDSQRAKLLANLTSATSLSRADMIKTLNSSLKGEKKDIGSSVDLVTCIEIIETTSVSVKKAQTTNKKITTAIQKYISALNGVSKKEPSKETVKYINNNISVMKSISNDLTTIYGAIIGALKTRRQQCKAICIKALAAAKKTNTNKSKVHESSYDLFSNVIIN